MQDRKMVVGYIYSMIAPLELYKLRHINFIIFSSTSTQTQALNIVLRKVLLHRRLIGVKGVEEGDRISPLEDY